MGEERVFLENGIKRSLVRRNLCDILSVKNNPSLVGTGETAENAESRRFPAAAWS